MNFAPEFNVETDYLDARDDLVSMESSSFCDSLLSLSNEPASRERGFMSAKT